jgi:hypothetical protein
MLDVVHQRFVLMHQWLVALLRLGRGFACCRCWRGPVVLEERADASVVLGALNGPGNRQVDDGIVGESDRVVDCRLGRERVATSARLPIAKRNWQYHTTQHNTTQHNTTQHNTTQHNTTQHNTTQHNTTQHTTPQHNTTIESITTHVIEPNTWMSIAYLARYQVVDWVASRHS